MSKAGRKKGGKNKVKHTSKIIKNYEAKMGIKREPKKKVWHEM